jgi:hypothetical protein
MEAASHVREALVRIQTEYVEMPHLKLTARQVQRLWSLPNEVCEAALAALLLTGFLVQLSDGAYVRDRVQRASVDRVESVGLAS